ncbi:hypothetical protein A2X44_00255 [candidate division CPR3 bacterium GWF2_35_18]|nr:MAG: hypothetical protein A2X44_00255 [candidate division CPR3 bacterium GWF2_35_18]OGB65586.1 MAG: hypothetical protein A2250_02255 [candidate division CPR3 bacterium RIFOXYA2_FULL_35_13]
MYIICSTPIGKILENLQTAGEEGIQVRQRVINKSTNLGYLKNAGYITIDENRIVRITNTGRQYLITLQQSIPVLAVVN